MILTMMMMMTNKDVAVANTKQSSEQGPEGRAGREGDLWTVYLEVLAEGSWWSLCWRRRQKL